MDTSLETMNIPTFHFLAPTTKSCSRYRCLPRFLRPLLLLVVHMETSLTCAPDPFSSDLCFVRYLITCTLCRIYFFLLFFVYVMTISCIYYHMHTLTRSMVDVYIDGLHLSQREQFWQGKFYFNMWILCLFYFILFYF